LEEGANRGLIKEVELRVSTKHKVCEPVRLKATDDSRADEPSVASHKDARIMGQTGENLKGCHDSL